MEGTWKVIPVFEAYQSMYNKLLTAIKTREDFQRQYSFPLMRAQIIKHNKRYLKGIALLRSSFGEQPTGSIVAKLIEEVTPTEN